MTAPQLPAGPFPQSSTPSPPYHQRPQRPFAAGHLYPSDHQPSTRLSHHDPRLFVTQPVAFTRRLTKILAVQHPLNESQRIMRRIPECSKRRDFGITREHFTHSCAKNQFHRRHCFRRFSDPLVSQSLREITRFVQYRSSQLLRLSIGEMVPLSKSTPVHLQLRASLCARIKFRQRRLNLS